jgi:hypothetical protein
MQMVESQSADIALWIGRCDDDVAVATQQRNQIGLCLFVPVHLATLQRGRCSGGIGDDLPFDALEMRNLAARRPFRRFLARHVGVILLPRGTAARNELVL